MNIIFKLTVIIAALMPDKTTQIVGGKDGAIEDFPYIAEIQRREKRRDTWEHACGAVILSENFLLTSAACLKGPKINRRVQCGFADLSDPNKQIKTFKHIKKHPHYDRKFKDNDDAVFDNNIAVIELDTPLVFGPKVQSIPYTTIKDVGQLNNCQILGWGFIDANKTELPDTLQFADISVLSNAECNALADPPVVMSQICAYDYANMKQACNKDAGGPLTCEIDGSRVLVGVFSWLYDICDAEFPFGYQAVAYYTSFIDKWTGIKGTP